MLCLVPLTLCCRIYCRIAYVELIRTAKLWGTVEQWELVADNVEHLLFP